MPTPRVNQALAYNSTVGILCIIATDCKQLCAAEMLTTAQKRFGGHLKVVLFSLGLYHDNTVMKSFNN